MTHEIGHTVGILHSEVKESLMYARRSRYAKAKLHQDDIDAIQALYGKYNDKRNNLVSKIFHTLAF